MSIAVQCSCGRRFKAADEHAGKQAKCPGCGQPLVITAHLQSPANVASPTVADASPAQSLLGVASLLDEPGSAPLAREGIGVWSPISSVEEPQKRRKNSWSLFRCLIPSGENTVSAVMLVVVLAICGGVSWGGWLAYKRIRFVQTIIGSDAAAAEQLLADDLPYAVAYCNTASPDDVMQKRMQKIAGLLPKLPNGADLSPLMEIRPKQIAYQAAYDLVRQRSEKPWLVDKLADANGDVRRFAAEALRPTFPFGQLDERQLARLIEPMELPEKQKQYAEIYEEIHRSFEQKLVGQYRVKIAAEWRLNETSAEPQSLITAGPTLIVSSQDHHWTIEFFGQRWTGSIDELPQAAVQCPAGKAADELASLPKFDALSKAGAELMLTVQDQAFRVDPIGLPRYVPEASGSIPLSTEATTNDAYNQVPLGAQTEVKSFYVNGRLLSRTLEWKQRLTPGFSKFDLTLDRVAPAASSTF
jgi:hypothetical protein